MGIFKVGNVTIETSDADQAETQTSGGTINGGVYGGENYGIKGGVFHGNVTIETSDQQ
ncbi:hypothetical protein ACIPJN_38780 [Streptomyces sp. NPDC086796]|uniref:hypothetical protein n=1 Tax=unclassified Streptomyces TaxID=2593676 RepID=UPI003800A7C2